MSENGSDENERPFGRRLEDKLIATAVGVLTFFGYVMWEKVDASAERDTLLLVESSAQGEKLDALSRRLDEAVRANQVVLNRVTNNGCNADQCRLMASNIDKLDHRLEANSQADVAHRTDGHPGSVLALLDQMEKRFELLRRALVPAKPLVGETVKEPR